MSSQPAGNLLAYDVQQPTKKPWYKNGAIWWAAAPVISFGLLCWAPTLWGWLRFRDRNLLAWTVGLAVTTVLAFGMLGAAPTDREGTPVGAVSDIAVVLILVLIVTGVVKALLLRHRVPLRPGGDAQTLAVARVEELRARRAEARRIVDQDASMARELGIGRPDRPGRTYDDGGLVDINHANAAALVQILEINESQAAEIVRVRDETHGFGSVAEVGAYTSLPPMVVDGMKDRAVFIRY